MKITQNMKDQAEKEWNALTADEKKEYRPGGSKNPACRPSDKLDRGNCTFYARNLVDGKWQCWQGHFDTGLGSGGQDDPYYMMQCATNTKCKNSATRFAESDKKQTQICPALKSQRFS